LDARMKPRHIVLVDDQAEITRMLSLALQRFLSAEVTTYNDAQQALLQILAERDAVSMVISDLKMPGMDGLTLIRHLREQGITFPAMIISAYLTNENIEQGKALGVNLFLQKPFGMSTFIQHVRDCLGDEE